MSLTIEQMDLAPKAEQAARNIKKKCPGVVFLSGRRTLEDQARAMAQNVIHDRQYIGSTYALSAVSSRLQQWVNRHPEADTVPEIEKGLLTVFSQCTPEQQLHISRHLTGSAFDIVPESATEEVINEQKPYKFLKKEGKLIRWHIEVF